MSKESMTDSNEIKNSVFEWLSIIETKIVVDDGIILRTKITLTIWQHKNISTFRANGGFSQISKILILCHWDIDMISSRHCLPCNDCNKKQEKNDLCLHIFTSTNNWRHEVHFLHGENGTKSCWTLYHSESQKNHQALSERCDTLLTVFGKLFRKKAFMNSTYFVTDWSFTADGDLL